MKKRSLLLTVGLFILVAFVLTMYLSEKMVSAVYSSLTMETATEEAEILAESVRSEMMDYQSLSWLLTYWEEHYDELDIPVGGLNDAAWLARHEAFSGGIRIKAVTAEQAADMSPENQRLFADICYMEIAYNFDWILQEFLVTDISCVMYQGGEEEFVYFKGLEKETSAKGYPLGELESFDPEMHPIAIEIYETGKEIDDVERITSTEEDKEYLDIHIPVVVGGEMRCMITEAFKWSDVERDIKEGARLVTRINALWMFLLLIILMVMLYWGVIFPLSKMQKNVRNYKDKKDSEGVRAGLEKIAKVKNEIGFLATDVSDMVVEIDRYVQEVRDQVAEKERIGTELSLASKIQAGMLPNTFPAFPDRAEFDIYASMAPAKEVGGDFYDFFLVDDDHLYMAIADVSGKGVPAALFMMSARILLADHAALGRSPAKVLEETNTAICTKNQEQMFVTVWVGILEISTGRLTAASAGHEYPVLYTPGGRYELFEDERGLPIGVMEGLTYEDYEIMLSPGAKFFIYTDGVPEAKDADGEMFELERMVETLNQDTAAAPEQVLANIRLAVDGFVKGAEQFDDLTMLCLEYKGMDKG